MKIKVAVDPADNRGKTIAATDRERLNATLTKLAGTDGALLAAVADPGKADWLLRLHDGKVYLLPASGLPARGDKGALPELFGPYADNAELLPVLQERLGRIARVQNLKKLAIDPAAELARGRADDSTDPAVSVKLEIRLLPDKDSPGQPIAWPAPNVQFFDGDRVQFRVHNPNPFPVDVTLLYIDSSFAINCLYPLAGEVSRIEAKTTWQVPTVRARTKIAALEHLVLIAVKSQKLQQPVDFSALEQDSLEKAQDVERTRGDKARGLATPLGQLLQFSLYGKGTRAIDRQDIEDSALLLYSWRVAPGKRP